MFRSPSRGGDFRDVLNRCVCEARQGVGQVFANRDLESSTAFHNREDGNYARSGLFAADVDPVRDQLQWGASSFGEISARLQDDRGIE